MSSTNEPDVPPTTGAQRGGSRRRRSKKPVVVALAVIGGLAFAPQVLPASAESPGSSKAALGIPVPPEGSAWVQGVLTDQAGHGLDNINVEVWSTDPGAAAPVGSNLSYGGLPADGRHKHGAWRVQVPVGQPYRIVFSAVGDQEDGDAYRMASYGGGRPVMIRGTAARALGKASAAGVVRGLGTTQLVHQGRVKSAVKVKRTKVTAGKKGKLQLRVTSPFVTDTTGKVVVRLAGRKVTDRLTQNDHGKTTIRLPKLHKAGKVKGVATYQGSSTVKGDKSPVKITVKKKKSKK